VSVHEGRREDEINVAWKSLSVSVTKVFSEREETRSLMRWMYGCLGVAEGVETVVGVELEGPRGGLLARWRKDAYDASSAMTSVKVVRRIVGGPSDLLKEHPFPIE
jgi:hypothetical protein